MDMKTRSGVKPVVSEEIKFTITTQEAEHFIQEMFDKVVLALNAKAREKGKKDVMDNVNIMLLTSVYSNKFLPFLLVLPASVAEGKDRDGNESENSIFDPENGNDAHVKIKQPLFEIVQIFAYNKNDKKAFFSNEWRRQLGISSRTSHELNSAASAKIQKLNGGRDKYITILLDPLRVFKAMLQDVNNISDKYYIEIGKKEKIKNGNWKYEVYRIKDKNKKGKHNRDADRIRNEIAQRISRGK